MRQGKSTQRMQKRWEQDQELLAQQAYGDLQREDSYQERSEDTEVERTEARWHDTVGVRRTKQNSKLVAKIETE